MGMLRLTNNQWVALQAHADRPKVIALFNRVNLGVPAGYDNTGNPTDVTPSFWVFDDHRIGGNWRVRVAAGVIHVQNWDEPIGGTMIQELTLAQAIAAFA